MKDDNTPLNNTDKDNNPIAQSSQENSELEAKWAAYCQKQITTVKKMSLTSGKDAIILSAWISILMALSPFIVALFLHFSA